MSVATIIGFLVALVAVYSPIAAAASYAPIIGHFDVEIRRRMAIRLFFIVAVFVVAAVWVGEFVVEVVGVSTTTLSAVGGLALLIAGIPMMRGLGDGPPEDPTGMSKAYESPDEQKTWSDLLITPITFPLSVGGTTIAISVASASQAVELADLLALSAVGVAYAAIVGVTNWIGGSIPGFVGTTWQTVLHRAAGVLLTAIGLALLVDNVTKMMIEAGLSIG